MRRLTLRLRLWLGFILIAVLPLTGLSWLYLNSFERALTETVLQTISAIADKKAGEIDDFINERIADARIASRYEGLPRTIAALSRDFAGTRESALQAIDKHRGVWMATLDEYAHHGRYHDLLLIDAKGNVVFSLARESDLGTNLNSGPHRDSGLARAFRQAMNLLHADLTPFDRYEPSDNRVATFSLRRYSTADDRSAPSRCRSTLNRSPMSSPTAQALA